MIRIVKPKKPYIPEIGDIDIYGNHHEYLAPFDWDDLDENSIKSKNPMPITGSYAFSVNPWYALVKAGIDKKDVDKLKKMSRNYCPCADMKYYAIVPIAILADDATVYTKDMPTFCSGMLNDGSWNRKTWAQTGSFQAMDHISDVERAILGSGYNEGIIPSDGSHSLIFATIPLDNGDKIVVVGWEWYNKEGDIKWGHSKNSFKIKEL